MKRVFIFFAIVLTSGCTNWKDNDVTYLRKTEAISIDKVETTLIANTGDMIITSWPLKQRDTILIKNSLTVTGENTKRFVGVVGVKSHNFETTLPAGPAVLAGNDQNGNKYYESTERLKYNYGSWRRTVTGGILIPRDSSKPARIYWYPPEELNITVSAEPTELIQYNNHTPIKEFKEFSGFGKTITYLGLSKGQIHFVYKEFDGQLIRTAFTQEFSFDYEPEKEYVYKDAKFIVHKASSNDINLTVKSHF